MNIRDSNPVRLTTGNSTVANLTVLQPAAAVRPQGHFLPLACADDFRQDTAAIHRSNRAAAGLFPCFAAEEGNLSNNHLATYLNDHLAGSTVALELLKHLEQIHAGDAVGTFASHLKADVLADRNELEILMGRLGIATSRVRASAAWLSEKFTALKLRLEDPSGGAFRLLEIFDALSTGIEGKRLLWRALSTAEVPGMTGAEYERLEKRAESQRSQIEAVRLESAKKALRTAHPSAS